MFSFFKHVFCVHYMCELRDLHPLTMRMHEKQELILDKDVNAILRK